jgi:hypothetical protein
MINRSALIVRPKKPYLDWAAGLNDAGVTDDLDGDETVYLIPEIEDEIEMKRVLTKVFSEIFEQELMAWHTDESAWPQMRSLAMFRQWFELEFHGIVVDLGNEAISNDED